MAPASEITDSLTATETGAAVTDTTAEIAALTLIMRSMIQAATATTATDRF
jgi:hypothetical protein